MKIKIPSVYLLPEDVGDGGKVTFLTAGEKKKNQFGRDGYQFKVRTPDGSEKLVTLNKKSLKYMIKHFTDETDTWIGKEVAVFPVKQMVSNSMKNVLYFGELPTEDEPAEEVSTEDIPF